MQTRRAFLTMAAGSATGLCLPRAARGINTSHPSCGQVVLADGRRLSYNEFGVRDCELTILFFHGMPASGLEAGYFHDAAVQSRCRILAPTRPGVGRSSCQPNRRVTDWPGDVEQFAAAMGLSEFSIIGYSTGGPYALSCASHFGWPTLKSVALVNGIAPVCVPFDAGISATVFDLALRRPWIVGRGLQRLDRMLCRHPEFAIRLLMRDMPEADRDFVCDSARRQRLINTFRIAVGCGTSGSVYELGLQACPWGFSLRDIKFPVRLWYSECDTVCRSPIGNYLLGQLPPNQKTSCQIFSREGHLSVCKPDRVQEILEQLVHDSTTAPA